MSWPEVPDEKRSADGEYPASRFSYETVHGATTVTPESAYNALEHFAALLTPMAGKISEQLAKDDQLEALVMLAEKALNAADFLLAAILYPTTVGATVRFTIEDRARATRDLIAKFDQANAQHGAQH